MFRHHGKNLESVCKKKIQGQLQLALTPLQIDIKNRLLRLVKSPARHLGPIFVKRKRIVVVSVATTDLRSMPDPSISKNDIKRNQSHILTRVP